MAFDAGTVERVRDALDRLGERGFREKHVFGGWGFLYGKNTFVIVWGEGILAKLPRALYETSLARPGVRPFTPGGERPMGTWAVVHAEVIADDPELAEWVELGLQGMREGPAAIPSVSSKAKSSTKAAGAVKTAKTAKSKQAQSATTSKTAKSKSAKSKPSTAARTKQGSSTTKAPHKGKPATRRR